jgi:endonuclease G
MLNMAPQLPGLNRQGWERLEEYVRSWAYDRGELVVYVGPVLLHDTRTIGARKVTVPTAFWKVVVDRSKGDAMAFIMPQKAIPKGDPKKWQTTIATVEDAAGLKLKLPGSIDRETKPAPWTTNLAAWKQKHKDTCAKQKRGKK